jgi:hypothetical protein
LFITTMVLIYFDFLIGCAYRQFGQATTKNLSTANNIIKLPSQDKKKF